MALNLAFTAFCALMRVQASSPVPRSYGEGSLQAGEAELLASSVMFHPEQSAVPGSQLAHWASGYQQAAWTEAVQTRHQDANWANRPPDPTHHPSQHLASSSPSPPPTSLRASFSGPRAPSTLLWASRVFLTLWAPQA